METDRHASFISETQLSYRALGSPVQHRSSQIPLYSALGASRNLAAKARDAAPPHAAWRQGDRLEGQNVLLGLPQTDHCPPHLSSLADPRKASLWAVLISSGLHNYPASRCSGPKWYMAIPMNSPHLRGCYINHYPATRHGQPRAFSYQM